MAKFKDNDAAVARFQEMLRCPTVWGGATPDRQAFDEFIPLLERLFPLVFARLQFTRINTYGIMLRWAGRDPKLEPVILMAHHDVVIADAAEWTHPPFAAEIHDGRIYARGAVDTKCILAALLEATTALLQDDYTPPRDIYICSSNCEEDMGDTAPAMVEYLRAQNVVPLFVLDEGGAVIDDPPLGVKKQFAAIGVAEKGRVDAYVTVHAKAGHAANPAPDDAPAKLVKGLTSMIARPAPARLAAPVEAMLRALAAHSNLALRAVFANLWLTRPLVLGILKGNSETAAMVRSTYALTELHGSSAINVIPQNASAGINIRIDPSESVADVAERLKTHFDDSAQITLENPTEPSPISPYDNAAFDYLAHITNSVYPDAIVAPYVQSSISDARHFARLCPNTYRFAGFLLAGDQRSRVHGKDENLHVDAYLKGINFYMELMRELEYFDA